MKKSKHSNSYMIGVVVGAFVGLLAMMLKGHFWIFFSIGLAIIIAGLIWRGTKDTEEK